MRFYGECHKSHATLRHANSDPTLFPIIFASIGPGQERSVKHFCGIREMEAVLANIRTVLRVVPLKSHCNSKCSYTSISINSLMIKRSRAQVRDTYHKIATSIPRRPKTDRGVPQPRPAQVDKYEDR